MSAPVFFRFLDLHRTNTPLLIANAWDAVSAALWQRAGAPAIGTSSAALAWACGYADGGALPLDALLHQVRAIARVSSVPVSIDLEDGYSDDPHAVAELAKEIAAIGAVGINLEDGAGTPELLMEKIRMARQALGDTPLFINARTDAYLRGLASGRDAVDMAIHRLSCYRDAGADGGFVPGITDIKEIAEIAAKVAMPLNVMTVPGLPSLLALREAGVRRISAGPALFQHAFGAGVNSVEDFLAGNFSSVPRAGIEYASLNRLLW
ncbi:isocitrate lyase/PEP mutase family protein [Xanthomonas sacchari]|uniref:isocitrate lyase/PEP mutase family protein n=1 Tax=Xanthomonas sacchari TaxID=56458 RepID=UPI00225639AE|nr:isocitrate lyase/phosphoenolpyruvate mutase family protein [Xanthomonas sacchari]MCW0447992.1 hypothetical protein [Xanthomonas sacchari]